MNFGINTHNIVVAAIIFAVSTLCTTGIVGAYLVWIEPDHFISKDRGLAPRIDSAAVRMLFLVSKNLLGVALIAFGVVLSLPGVPGQGLLTIFVGVLLLDIRGKRRFELALVRRPIIRDNIDRLRRRFNKPPLQLEPSQTARALAPPEATDETPTEAKMRDDEKP